MKTMFLMVLMMTFGVHGSEIRPMQPSHQLMQYDKMPAEVHWMFMHMEAWGFDTPKDGQTFSFSDYLRAVPDNVPQQYDVCFFVEGDTAGFGFVQSITDDKNIVVMSSAGSGLIVVHAIDPVNVRGILRPYKHSDKI